MVICYCIMNNQEVHHRKNPRLNANIFSKLFFCWIFPYLSYGSKHELENKDILKLAPQNQCDLLGDQLEKFWKAQMQEAQRKQCRPSFLKAITKTFGRTFLKYGIISAVSSFSPLMVPLVLKLLISHFTENSTSSMLKACSYVLLLILVMIIDSLIHIHSKFLMYYLGGQVKTACSLLIYRKILKLRIDSQDRSDGGKMVTLLSNDVSQFEEIFIFLHVLFVLPIIIIMYGFLLWRTLGVTTIFAVPIVILIYVPFDVFSTGMVSKLREKAARRTDRRLLLMDEIINGIHVIKMYTWENPIKKLILLARRKEWNLKMKKLYFDVVLRGSLKYGICSSIYLTIVLLVIYEEKLTSVIIFPLIQYIFEMNLQFGHSLGRCLSSLANGATSVNRIEDFLLLEEVTPLQKSCSYKNNVVVAMENVCIAWVKDKNHDFLQNVSISIHPNKLYVLVGEIGSGKSTLLKMILGELKPKSGKILKYGDISYASQEPWLFNESIRSNILLGQPFDEEKYNKVISSCALQIDFEQLPHGDKTIVGERSAALSGGQSIRINLARAAYRAADVYLLDDPIASIDYSVGKCLFEKCINGLLKDKTRILVTQNLEYIKKADEIIVMDNGRVEYQGEYQNFQKTEVYRYLLKNFERDTTVKALPNDFFSSCKHIDDCKENEIPEFKETEKLLYEDPVENIEHIKRGKIQFALLAEFYNNKILVACSIICVVLLHTFSGGFEFFVGVWSKNQDKYYVNPSLTVPIHLDEESNFSHAQTTLLYIIGGILVGILVSYTMQAIFFVKLHRVSCERLHSDMISSLLQSTIKFFDNNDSGRILNRFSQDLGVVDEMLPIMLECITVSMVILVSALQVIIASPYMGIPLLFSLFLVYGTTIFFSKLIRQTKRLEARAKALVLSHSNATFIGLSTIRSSSSQEMLQKSFNIQQDNYMAAYFTNTDIISAYCIWNAIILKSFVAIIAFSFVFLKPTGISSATVGFCMMQTFIATNRMLLTAETIARFNLSMISAERTLEYKKLENEVNSTEKNCLAKSASSWPSDGKIQFDHLYLHYSNSVDPVLKNINFVIEPKTKVGIIGRTGAGKSSLSIALFRLAEIQGSVVIDGIDTKTLTLKDLRSKISILPQKTIFFSTSLRKNLDPLELYEDVNIWSALKCVQMDNIFHSLDEELNQKTLSIGQRQLLCLARIILKKNKILILDEATANMDARTDNQIKRTISENFKDCTILTIAHKLNSIIDCDKILVIDAGKVYEYDEPRVLLQQEDSYFYKMWHTLNNLA